MVEIEKTFLVKRLPANLGSYQSKIIKQGYISVEPEVLRIRQNDNRFEITKKMKLGDNSLVKEEINIPLTQAEFDKLWTLTVRSLQKTRYLIPLQSGQVAELDVFEDKLKGYVIVEVEFKLEGEMNEFVPPEWFGEDISNDDISVNNKLATMTFEQIQERLKNRK